MDIGEQRRLIILSSLSEVRRLAKFCKTSIGDAFSESSLATIELAIVEAANNILRHAYHQEKGHPLLFFISHCGDFFELMFVDQGATFDQSKVLSPTFDWENIADIPEGGWGIYLIKSIMDFVSYEQNGDVNILRMRKNLPNPIEFDQSLLSYDKMHSLESKIISDHDVKDLKSRVKESDIAIEEMAEELSSAYESLNLFYTLSRDVALISDLNTFLNNTLERVIAGSAANWGVVRLKKGNDLTLIAQSDLSPVEALHKHLSLEDKTQIEVKVAYSLIEAIDNSYLDVDVHVICMPIVGLDEFLGTILLGKNDVHNTFSSGDAKLARAMADQLAVSIENNRLYTKAMDAELDKQELQIATNLQKRLIDQTIPIVEGAKFFTKIEPAKQVGGDYLVLEKVDETTVFIIVFDAMGKGMSASYFSLLSHMAIHSLLIQQNKKNITPGELLSLVNKVMFKDFDRFGMFMTGFIGKIDLKKNLLTYASAGHCPPILYSEKDGLEQLDTLDFMLGVENNIKYRDFYIDFLSGMKLLVYSDGLTDIVGEHENLLGVDFLNKVSEQAFKKKNIKSCCQYIYNRVLEESGGQLQDDIAMIGVERV